MSNDGYFFYSSLNEVLGLIYTVVLVQWQGNHTASVQISASCKTIGKLAHKSTILSSVKLTEKRINDMLQSDSIVQFG